MKSSRLVFIPAVIAVVWIAGLVLPVGLPFGVVLQGLVLGALSSMTALGLVLIYRSTRIINFAQAEIGGLAAAVATVMVTGWRLPYLLAVPVGLVVALATGWLIDATVVRRFFTAPRLILTVATIGLAQILGALEILLPTAITNKSPLTAFKTPFHFSFAVGPLFFKGDHVVAMVVVPVVLGSMAWFFSRSDTGIAVRAAADSHERALLLGIPVRRLSKVTWVLAAGLSGLGAILTAPILGPDLGAVAGPAVLLAPLTAAVIARMESLPVTVMAALGIGVFEQAVFWNYPRSSAVDVGLFALVLVALLLQRRRAGRVDDGGLGGYVAAREVRPIPELLARLPEVRNGIRAAWGVLAVVALLVPILLDHSQLTLLAYFTIYGIIAVSLVVLTGWAGQISLGQFAFVGIGAATTGSLLLHAHADVFVALFAASLVGAAAAAIVGIPALRIPGLFLAVTTLAFGVPVSTYLLNSSYFPTLTPARVQRPDLLNRISLDSPLTFYYACLAGLVGALVVARNFRRSRAGRVVVAVRDNERGAASFSIEPVRAKLVAFAVSGALAGFAGGLYAIALRGVPFSAFSPVASLTVFTMVIVGGVTSLPGAVLGAVYVEGAEHFLHGGLQLLATGAGLLLLLMVVPGGLTELAYAGRDRVLRALARRRGLSVPSLAEQAAFEPVEVETEMATDSALVRCTGINASYGQIQVLFGVDVDVIDGEIVGLLGTNGAGKSTVLRVISGLLPPSAGRVEFEGRDITHLDPVARVKAGLVTVPGGRGVFASLTVAENLRLAGWLARGDPSFLAETHERVFDLFPVLRERLATKASSLSGGEQQMLCIAQALFCRPRLLMIDELSLGLAPAVVATLLDVVRRINTGGTTVVVVEQSVNVATSLADRAVFMEKGQVRFSGKTKELVGRTDLLRSVFLRSNAPARRSDSTPERSDRAAPILSVRGIGKSFGGVTAVRDVDLSAPEGSVLGIIGSNGAGKTTLFDLCSGFLTPDTGSIWFEGQDVTHTSAAHRAGLGMGRSFQDARLFPSMTVLETIATAFERHVDVREPVACLTRVQAVVDSEHAVAARVDELVETMGLSRYRDAFIAELSTGTRRIVELACALAHSPSVLLLDEPSSGIAQRETEALGDLLLDLKARTGMTMVVIEHDIPLISSIADELVCLHLGQVIAAGSPASVLAEPLVVASYLGTDPTTIARSGSAKRPRGRRDGPRSKAASR